MIDYDVSDAAPLSSLERTVVMMYTVKDAENQSCLREVRIPWKFKDFQKKSPHFSNLTQQPYNPLMFARADRAI